MAQAAQHLANATGMGIRTEDSSLTDLNIYKSSAVRLAPAAATSLEALRP